MNFHYSNNKLDIKPITRLIAHKIFFTRTLSFFHFLLFWQTKTQLIPLFNPAKQYKNRTL